MPEFITVVYNILKIRITGARSVNDCNNATLFILYYGDGDHAKSLTQSLLFTLYQSSFRKTIKVTGKLCVNDAQGADQEQSHQGKAMCCRGVKGCWWRDGAGGVDRVT